MTTYRAGTMTTVLAAKDEKDATPGDEEIILDDVKLPDSAPATLKTLKAEGRKWYLTITWNEQMTRPFALFVHTNSAEKNVTTNDAIEVLVKLAKSKKIPKKHLDMVLEKTEKDNNASKITRLISFNLRHGVLIKNIVSALDQVEEVYVGSFLFQIKKFLASFIKDGEKVEGKICENCGSHNIVFSEGCNKCNDCGSSKCG
jgi:ribonucleoside-diphosphate reductase alpha chain